MAQLSGHTCPCIEGPGSPSPSGVFQASGVPTVSLVFLGLVWPGPTVLLSPRQLLMPAPPPGCEQELGSLWLLGTVTLHTAPDSG